MPDLPNVPVDRKTAAEALRARAFSEQPETATRWLAVIGSGVTISVGTRDPKVVEDVEAAARRAGIALERHPEDARSVIHSRAGGLGADWDLADALAFVDAADEIVWSTSLMRHDLAVRCGRRVVCFDVPRPDREAAAA